jgi:hypothetical protein
MNISLIIISVISPLQNPVHDRRGNDQCENKMACINIDKQGCQQAYQKKDDRNEPDGLVGSHGKIRWFPVSEFQWANA